LAQGFNAASVSRAAMGCGSSVPEADVDLVHVEGAENLAVFAEGKFVVPPGKHAIVHMCRDSIIAKFPSCKVVEIGSDSKETFTVNPVEVSGQALIIIGNAAGPVFAVTGECKKLTDALSIYAIDESCKDKDGLFKDERFKVSTTKKHNSKNFLGQTTTGIQTLGGNNIELNGTLDIFGCHTGRRGSRGGHIRLGGMSTGKPIAKLVNAKERPDLNLQRPTWNKKGTDPDDYLLEVAPGVDMALILAMVLATEVLENCDRAMENALAGG